MSDLKTVLEAVIDAQAQWHNIGIQLGITEGVLNGLAVDNTLPRPRDRLSETLAIWLRGVQPQPTWERLANALKSRTVGEFQLAKSIENMYCSLGENDLTGRREKYSEYLKCLYQQRSPVQWPELPHYEYVTLAMIEGGRIPYGKMDKFAKLTVRGKSDDILRKKKKTELKDIFFKKKNNTNQVILIEGAPGAGKTMLVWHICREWGRNKLFTQFRVIVLATLRDPTVQRAKSITDVLLLPANKKDAQKVASKMRECHGRGVLFLLDGWDELPEKERKSETFLFRKLIEKPKELSLDEAAIIVTSRPVSSKDLRHWVSSRIEIVGFISSRIKEYFETCLKSEEEHAGELDKLLHTVEDNPLIESLCYLPLNAAIVVYLFCACDHELPSTYHELFQSLVIHCILRNEQKKGKDQSESQEHQHQQNFSSFEELHGEIKGHFRRICQLAYSATKEEKITLSSSTLDSFEVLNHQLGLMQAVPSLLRHGEGTTYHFLHLSLQELLAAYHISKLTSAEQVQVFNDLFDTPRFSAVFGFYAGFTKFEIEGIRPVVSRIVQDVKSKAKEKTLLVSLMNWLYEAQDTKLCNFVQKELTTDQHEKLVGGNGVLNLSNTSLKPSDVLSVGYFLSTVDIKAGEYFRADLSSCSIEDHHVRFLVKGLSYCEPTTNTTCIEMNLSENNIHAEGIIDIANFLQKSKVIKALNLRGNKLSHSAQERNSLVQMMVKWTPCWKYNATLPRLMEALADNSSLTALDISECSLKLTGEVGKSLRTMLEKNKSLLTLDISSSRISPDYIADGIRKSSLQALHMRYCTITTKGVGQISVAIQNSELEELSIGPLDDSCMEPLSIALPSLRSLTLRGETVTDEGLETLGNALQGNNSLLELNLRDFRKVTSKGLNTLVWCLQQNSTLKSLKVSKDHAKKLEKTVCNVNKSRQLQLKLETQT